MRAKNWLSWIFGCWVIACLFGFLIGVTIKMCEAEMDIISRFILFCAMMGLFLVSIAIADAIIDMIKRL